jgi:integrase
MSLFKRGTGNCYHYRFSWNGQQYRGSCKTSRKAQAEKVEALVIARLEENKPLPGSKKIPTLAEFSEQFFLWLNSLPTDRPPTEATKRYYRIGWRLLAKTKLAGMRLDKITEDDIRETQVGSSPANTNNALRTLRRMLNRAKKQKNRLIAEVPVVELVEEQSREMELQPWMEERLLAVTKIPRTPRSKFAPKSSNYGWQPFRDVLLIMLDTGLRPCEVFRMKREHIDWDRNRIFVPRSKSHKSRRFVGMTRRVRLALEIRLAQHDSVFVFPSKRSFSGHIVTVQKQFDDAKELASLPESIVLYCARHRFGSDAMDGTGNVYAVADAMGHSRMDLARRYQHPMLQKVTEAIEKRNQQRVQ